jgi:hypothetical protein
MAESVIKKDIVSVVYSSNTAVTIDAQNAYQIKINDIIPDGMVPISATTYRNGSQANAYIASNPFLDADGWYIKFINYYSMAISVKPYARIFCI